MIYKKEKVSEVVFGTQDDIESWMELVNKVSWNFPGLETKEKLKEHEATVLKFIEQKRALCIKNKDNVVGVMLISKKHNMICCLAVDPDYRRKGIATKLMAVALNILDTTRDISVSTFQEGDPKGIAPRTLYKKFGFQEAELIEEFGYPNQKFVLYAENRDEEEKIDKSNA